MRESSTPHSPDVARTADPPRDELPVAPGLSQTYGLSASWLIEVEAGRSKD